MEKVWIIQKVWMCFSGEEFNPDLEVLGVFTDENVARNEFFAEKSHIIATCKKKVPTCTVQERDECDVLIEDEETFDSIRLILSEHNIV